MSELIFLEDFQVGLHRRSGTHRVSKEEIIDFARTWDPQPFHVDEEAARTSIYGGLVACSAHIFALFTRLANSMEPRAAALAALGFDELRTRQPLRAGDSVYFRSECLDVRRSRTKPDRGIVAGAGTLINQHGGIVFSAKTAFMVQCRDGGQDAGEKA
jgi:acyl dehydratase